jgi:prolipoprotein diacylglyceryltransferase
MPGADVNTADIILAGPYNLFYFAGFLVAIAIAWRAAGKAGIESMGRLLFLAACVLGGLLGSRFLHFDLNPHPEGARTVLGGLVAVVIVATLTARALRLPGAAIDSLAVALPTGFAVGRIGCFLSACTFGTPTDLPWAVTYGPGTAAFARQVEMGLLGHSAAHTLGVHPTQLYEAAAAIVIGLVANARLSKGSSGILLRGVLAPYLAIRLVTQLLRGGEATPVGPVLLLVFAVLGTIVVAAPRLTRLLDRAAMSAHSAGVNRVPLALLPLIGLLAVVTVHVATPLELTVLGSLATVAILALLSRTTSLGPTWRSGWAQRLVPTGPSALALLMLQIPANPDAFPQRYVTVGGSVSRGAYVETCGGAHRFATGGASIAYTVLPEPDTRLSVRLQGFAGEDEDTSIEGPDRRSSIGGGAVLASAQGKWIAGSLGAVVGSFTIDGEVQSATPVIGLALGPPSFFVEGRYADYEPAGVPGPLIQLGIGARVAATGSLVRGGISETGVYGSALVVTPGGWEIEPRFSYGDSETYQGGIGIRKRITLNP